MIGEARWEVHLAGRQVESLAAADSVVDAGESRTAAVCRSIEAAVALKSCQSR